MILANDALHLAHITFVEDGVHSQHYRDHVFRGATLVSRNFCFVMSAGVPVTVGDAGRLTAVTDADADIYIQRPSDSGRWFKAADDLWDKYSKDGGTKSFLEQLNFRNKLAIKTRATPMR